MLLSVFCQSKEAFELEQNSQIIKINWKHFQN